MFALIRMTCMDVHESILSIPLGKKDEQNGQFPFVFISVLFSSPARL